jgi:hypothetical protein
MYDCLIALEDHLLQERGLHGNEVGALQLKLRGKEED